MLKLVSTAYFKVELIEVIKAISKFKMKRNVKGQVKQNAINLNKTSANCSQSHSKADSFSALFQQKRENTAESILKFDFKKKRVRILSEASNVAADAESVVYWMSRDARVQDNWAFLFAQKLALKNSVPLQVCFCLVPKFLEATIRQYNFLLKGLEEVCEECEKLDIRFNLLIGPAGDKIPEFVRSKKVGAVVCDFSPLRVPQQWVQDVKSKLPPDVPLCQVDAHNIVPVWEASGKKEYAARTIRGKITKQLENYLTEFPPLIKHPHKIKGKHRDVDWKAAYHSLECNRDVEEVKWAQPGYSAGCDQLMKFCTNRLARFSDKRNDPVEDCLSGLSPWFHFGHISVQRCITTVQGYKSRHSDSVAAFCEEAIIRRELSDNFCFYNEKYDSIEGLENWALKTLNDHRLDKRSHIYTKEELENSRTHDDLWNSAQIQLVKEGKMHGFLRMYWAKKILEWTETPELALEIAIYLNDKYSLDGRDPNGYVGCMWSIGGVHDQGWKERSVFGKIRYMNYQGCKRKFDVSAFVARYGGKVYTKT